MKTLENLLEGQDLNAYETTVRVLDGDNTIDPVTSVIVEAWNLNGGPEGELDLECYRMDLNYAISQLKKALKASY